MPTNSLSETSSAAVMGPNSPNSKPSPRLSSIDALRGLVMIIMALDHVRDFFHNDAAIFSPTDLTRTTSILFFTRWITHFCLPVFMFAAGMGAFLWARNRSKRELSRFLLTRGLWFIVLELTVMQFAYNFNFHFRFLILLLILWIFGICMAAMAALVYLPMRWLALLSVAVIFFHNLLDGIRPQQFGGYAWAWNLLHQPGIIPVAGKLVLVTYTFLPWIGVMGAGFCFAQIFLMEPAARRPIMLKMGSAITLGFVVLRLINNYGDPLKWTHQKSAVFTLLSFLNTTKYPGSLDFVLMTLGPAMLLLPWFDQRTFKASNPMIVFGRVPMFYFVLHFYLIHIMLVLATWMRYGAQTAQFIFNPIPSMGGPVKLFPANFGYSLWTVYGVWILTLLILYPVCRWFANVKATRKKWWLSYL